MPVVLHEKVFTHRFTDFHGLRDTQSLLHPDSRFTRNISGVVGRDGFLRQRNGATMVELFQGAVSATWSDEHYRLVVVDGDLLVETLA